ncbi:hypothetical protein ABPG77_005321 [Micractinium sp. CCAP 211/92]
MHTCIASRCASRRPLKSRHALSMARALLPAALLLILTAHQAAAGIVSTDTYHCDPTTCMPPECLCASNSPPGNLTADEIPQFVLLSHDNALNNQSYNLMVQLLGSKMQSDGCRVPITWFAMRYHSDCSAGKSALQSGDELAMQANRFDPTDPFNATDPSPHYNSRDPVTGKPSVEIEITMSRKWWNEDCGVPIRDMIGYRSQNYYNNPPIRQTLSKDGYLYDATLVEWYYPNSPTSPSKDQVLWPYTMDAGIPQECDFLGPNIGKCDATENYKGLWEVPLYELQDGNTLYGFSDFGDTEAGLPPMPDMFSLFKSQLDQHVAGGRTPLQISTFYEWLSVKPDHGPPDDPQCLYCYRPPSDNAKALVQFVDYALKQPAVRFITYSDLIHWMQDPVPLSKFDAWYTPTCRIPGVKADLSAVNLTAAQLAEGAPHTAAPMTAPAAAPAPSLEPSPAPVLSPAGQPTMAPIPEPAAAAPSPAHTSVGGSESAAPPALAAVHSSAAARPLALATLTAGAAAVFAAMLLAL